MTVRIDRIHRKFDRPVLGQEPNETALIEVVGDQKSRRKQNAYTLQGGSAQRLAAVGDQIARHPHRCRRALAVDETPLVFKGIEHVPNAIVVGKFG